MSFDFSMSVQLFISSMTEYPLWQVSHGWCQSNGSFRLEQQMPIFWWLDMPIDLQVKCEKCLQSGKDTFELMDETYPFRSTQAQYVINLQTMSQLNLKNGVLRQIRRTVLLELTPETRGM